MPTSTSIRRRALHLAAALAVVTLSAGTAGSAGAQESPDLPFTAGQKALNVAVGESFGIGGLFFRSPTSAWQLEGSVFLQRSETEQDVGTGPTIEGDATDLLLQLRAGLRSMRALGGNTMGYRTVGLTGGVNRGTGETNGVENESTSWNAGVFLDLGGQYLFSPRFGLGVEVGAVLRYQSLSGESGLGGIDRTGFSLGTSAARLTGTVYF